MKNKMYKVLGVMLSICLVLTAVFCLPAIAEDVVDEVIVKDYYVRSNGYDIDDTTVTAGDGRTSETPAPTVADVVNTIIADDLGKGDIANVYIMQDADGHNAFDSATAYKNAKSYYKHNMTAWSDAGSFSTKWDFTMVVKSPENEQNYLAQTAYIGLKGYWYVSGPTIFENVILISTSNEIDRPITTRGNNVTFSKETDFTIINKTGTNQTLASNSIVAVGGNGYFPIAIANKETYTERVNLTFESLYLYKAPSSRTRRNGITLGSFLGASTFNEDVNIVIDNSETVMQFAYGGAKSTLPATFDKTLNINVKNAAEIKLNTVGTDSGGSTGKITVAKGLQIIYPSTTTFADLTEEFTTKGVTNYWILQRVSDNADVIDFAKDENGDVVAGKFVIAENYVATATNTATGETKPSEDGVLDLSQVPGTYTVTFEEYVEKVYDYYVAHGGTGDGRDINNPAPSVATAVATMNDIVGLTANDTANIWIMQDIAEVKNDGTVEDGTTTYNKHNLAYWGSVPSHTAKILVKPYENNQANNAEANLPTYLAISDRVGINARMNFAGPTEIDNIKIIYCTSTQTGNQERGIINFAGNSVKLGSGVKYGYANATKAGSIDWVGDIEDMTSLTTILTPPVTTEKVFEKPINVEIAHSITATNEKGGYIYIPSIDPAYNTFEKDVTLRITGPVNTGRLKLGEKTNAYPITFKQNLNVKITEAGGSWQIANGGNIIVEGGIQMIVNDEATIRGDSYPFSTIYAKAYTDDTYETPITDHWILNVNDAMVEAIDFIENEKGKFQIPEFHSVVATNVADTSLTYSADANGVLDLSEVPGEYTVVVKESEKESDTYKDYINYRGYVDGLTKYNGALANTFKKLSTETELNVAYMGGSTLNDASLRTEIGSWLQSNFTNVTIRNIDKSLANTGTEFGAIRVTRDVLSKNPDLLFIEYSLDDYLDGVSAEKSLMQFETIVREVKEVYPDCDIVTLFASTSEMGSELYDQASAQEEICEKYNITSINLGKNSEEYFAIINEFLANTLLFGEYGTDYEITNQTLPEMTSKYLYDGNNSFIFPVDVDFTTQGGSAYDDEVKGLGVADYVGMITMPANSGDTVTLTFDGTELYILTNENLSTDKTFKVSVDGGETWKVKHYSGSVLTNVVSGLVGGEHTVIIEPSIDTEVGVCGFYSRDIEKITNNLNICDLVYLNENNIVDTMFDYNNDQSVNTDDVSALKRILLSDYVKRDYFDTSHLIPIARLGYRPYTGTIPQQSIASYEKAYESGHRIMLCDIRLTSDGYMVCCHDDDISKVNAYDSNGVAVASGEVLISQTTLADLLTYDFGAYKKGYAGLQILQPEAFLEFCAQYDDITPVFEFKKIDDERIAQLVELIKQYGFEDNVMFLAGADTGVTVSEALPNSTIGRWYSTLNSTVIDVAASFGSAGKFVHVAALDYDNEDTINFENYVKAKAKGVDIGITYLSSSNANKTAFNELKNQGRLNFCKYISLDEVSWLYE